MRSVVGDMSSTLLWGHLHTHSGFDMKPRTHLSMLKSTAHRIGSMCQCGQHKQAEPYALNMLMCCQTQSDRCQSIKVSIILCVLSVDSFFAISVASATDKRIYVYS